MPQSGPTGAVKRESVAAVTGANLFASPPELTACVARFFTEHVDNAHTRRLYLRATRYFCEWCEPLGYDQLTLLYSMHIKTFMEHLQGRFSVATVKQYRAALQSLFIWLVKNDMLAAEPISAVPGPEHTVTHIKTPVLTARHIRCLFNSIPLLSPKDYRDRALIGMVVYCFARVSAVLRMRVEDYFMRERHACVRLTGNDGSPHEIPCHSELQLFVNEYISVAGIAHDSQGALFRAGAGSTTRLKGNRMDLKTAYWMFHRRAEAAGIGTRIGPGILRATAITSFLQNGGRLESAQWIANHRQPDTTALYDPRNT